MQFRPSVLVRGGKFYVINAMVVRQVQGDTAREAEFSETSMCREKQIKTRVHTNSSLLYKQKPVIFLLI